MKVSKAIEILELNVPKGKSEMPADIKDALTLGIEALKRHQNKDYITYNGMHESLPGETPETALNTASKHTAPEQRDRRG